MDSDLDATAMTLDLFQFIDQYLCTSRVWIHPTGQFDHQ